jgi:hypothetical protein
LFICPLIHDAPNVRTEGDLECLYWGGCNYRHPGSQSKNAGSNIDRHDRTGCVV